MATINPGIIIQPPFGGQRCDLDRNQVPETASGYLRNWTKRGGKFRVRPGFELVGTSLGEYPVGVIQYDHHSGDRFTVIATGTKWFAYDITTKDWVDITESGNALTGGEGTHQQFRVFYKDNKAWVVGVNGYNDAPKCWDGEGAEYDDIAGSPPNARCIAVCNNRLLLANTYTTQANIHQVDVSAFNDFEDGWGAVQTVNLMDTPGEIVTMCELGNLAVAIYKTDAIYMGNAQAASEPFAFTLSAPEIKGPASSRAVVQVPGGHVYMAFDGSFWAFNGVTPTPLPDSISEHVIQTADTGMLSRAFGFFDAVSKEIWFIYRGRGSGYMNMGVVISLNDMTVWPISFDKIYPGAGTGARLQESTRIGDLYMPIGELTDPIKDWSHLYDHIILCSNTGRVVAESALAHDDDGADITAVVETALVQPSASSQTPQQLFTAQESEHFFNKPSLEQNITVELGYSSRGEDTEYAAPRTIDISDDRTALGHRKTAKAFSLRLTAIPTSTRVQWRGSLINGSPRGVR